MVNKTASQPKPQEKDFSVQILGESYPTERCTDAHMLAMLEMFTTRMADVQAQSKAGCAIKEIIIPSISDKIISINRNGLYIIHLDISELNSLIIQLIKTYHLYDLRDIEEGRKPKSLMQETQEKIAVAQEALEINKTQESLEKTINLTVLSPEETEQAKNSKISDLQEQLKKLQEK